MQIDELLGIMAKLHASDLFVRGVRRPALRVAGAVRVLDAAEVSVATHGTRNDIRENKLHQAQSLMETGRGDGMITMDHALETLVKKRVIDRDEALRFMVNPKTLLDAEPAAGLVHDRR